MRRLVSVVAFVLAIGFIAAYAWMAHADGPAVGHPYAMLDSDQEEIYARHMRESRYAILGTMLLIPAFALRRRS